MPNKSSINYWMWGAIAAGLILAFWMGCNCGIKSVIKESRIDTVIDVDSFTKGYPFPVPYEVVKHTKGDPYPVIEWEHDTLPQIIVTRDVDTAVILSRFFATKHYDTTYELSNGHARIWDTVTQNIIKGRRVRIITFDTSTKETVTIYPPQKTVLYLGASAFGNRYNLVKGIGADFAVKTGDDMIYEARLTYISDSIIRKKGNLYYGVGAKVPLRNLNPFRKRKKR